MGPAMGLHFLSLIFLALIFTSSFTSPLLASVIPLNIPMSAGCDWFYCKSLLL